MSLLRRLQELPEAERRNSDPTSLSGRIERAWGWPGAGVVTAVGALVVLGVVGAVAWASRLPWLFPSVAPTVVLMLETPLRAQASPRNAVVGHLVGIGVGYCMLLAFGLTRIGPATVVGVGPRRIAAAALAVALTALVVNGIGLPHPPAASSTLVVALGVLRTPGALAVMAGSCVLAVALCVAINRFAGAAVPLWSPRAGSSSTDRSADDHSDGSPPGQAVRPLPSPQSDDPAPPDAGLPSSTGPAR